MENRNLINTLVFEKNNRISGGIYHKLQIDFSYNSNHIEGSRLTHEQTRYIFETQTVGIEPTKVNDIFETVNHFRCFDSIIDTVAAPLSEGYIKNIHFMLKTGTMSGGNDEAVIGDYKKYANFVGTTETTAPENVAEEMQTLLLNYNALEKVSLYDILDFHACFEKIHPFYDGNGRVGRLIMFKECLKNDIVPFYIDDMQKMYYYRGLQNWQSGGEKGFLADTCLLMQDNMKKILDHFEIDYDKTPTAASDVLGGR
ncbi:MAG: Fic family protein [Firmicutes bacterium]|nr:Fic family protein [Bacillota bacterium]